MRIGRLAEASGVSRDTLRYYEKQGLIRADRWPNAYRDYPEGMVEMVRMLRQGQALGFSLKEVGALVKGLGGGLSQMEVEQLLRGKLAEIDARMRELSHLRAVVARRLAEACPLGLDAPGSLDPKRVAS